METIPWEADFAKSSISLRSLIHFTAYDTFPKVTFPKDGNLPPELASQHMLAMDNPITNFKVLQENIQKQVDVKCNSNEMSVRKKRS